MATNKPYHLMTPAERTAARIASNRRIEENVQPVLEAREAVGALQSNVAVDRGLRLLSRELGGDACIDAMRIKNRAEFDSRALAALKALRKLAVY